MKMNIGEKSNEAKSAIHSEKYTRYARCVSKSPTLIFEYVSILGVDIQTSMVIDMAISFLEKFYFNPNKHTIGRFVNSTNACRMEVTVDDNIAKYFTIKSGDNYVIDLHIQEEYGCLHPEDKESYLKEILTLVHNIEVAYYTNGWYLRKDD